jgi:hypothetical protein
MRSRRAELDGGDLARKGIASRDFHGRFHPFIRIMRYNCAMTFFAQGTFHAGPRI